MDLWIDVKRPTSLDQIKGQDKNVKLFKHFLKTKQVPNLLLYGSKGTCKTSTILAFCHDLYGDDFRSHTIEMNASHERGINDVRNKIKMLSKQKAKHSFKFIILDEADSMTKDAMFALRMIMEDYSSTTRFCLICNYPYKILKPILSRCVSAYFPPINNKIMQELDHKFIEGTSVDIESRGDLRKHLLRLQCYGNQIDETFLKSRYTDIWNNLSKQDSIALVEDIIENTYNVQDILELWLDLALDDPTKIPILAECQYHIISGCDPFIQLVNLVNRLKKKIDLT